MDASEELLGAVAKRYGLSTPVPARRLAGGYANDVFRLDGAGPPAVLHVDHAHEVPLSVVRRRRHATELQD